MFKIGERRIFSFGSFTVDDIIETNFVWQIVRSNRIVSYKIVKVYRLTGRGTVYLGMSDKGHLLRIPPKVVTENIK